MLSEANGSDITVDIVSGSTYQITTASTASAAAVGGYVAAVGPLSGGQLSAVDLAFVPTPPAFIASSEVETTAGGELYFGQITAIQSGIITITTSEGNETIVTSNATNITTTAATTYAAVTVGATSRSTARKSARRNTRDIKSTSGSRRRSSGSSTDARALESVHPIGKPAARH